MFKGKFNTHYFFLLLVCGLGSVVQMTVAMQPSINMTGLTKTSEIIASKERKASEVSVADQKKVLGHESISQESTKLSSGSPFENYIRNGCRQRFQLNSALTQSASLLQDAQPTSSSVNSSGFTYASNVFPRIIPQRLSSSAASDPMLSPQEQSESDLCREDCSGYFRDDEDCCDDICYECCCVKNACAYCVLIAGIFWLKSITSSVQE